MPRSQNKFFLIDLQSLFSLLLEPGLPVFGSKVQFARLGRLGLFVFWPSKSKASSHREKNFTEEKEVRKKKERKGRTRQTTPPKMTPRQERFVANFTDPKSPGFSNATRAAQAAGYRGGNNQLAVQGHANLHNPDVRLAIQAALDKADCTIELGAKRLREGLNAKQVRPFLVDGQVIYSKPMPDYRERRQATELLFRLHAPMPLASREEEHALKLIPEQSEEQREGFSETKNPPHLPQAINATGISQTDSVLEQLHELNAQAQRLREKAERAGDLRTALAAVRELSRIVELMAKLRGDLAERGETKILNVHFDSDAAKRVVDTFLARHQESEVKNEREISD